MRHRHIHARHDEYIHVHRGSPRTSSGTSGLEWIVYLVVGFIVLSLIVKFWWVFVLAALGGAFKK
jgi:hypothetical protein